MLGVKAAEYAGDSDRLHNFRKAAALQGETFAQSLGGMLAKHVVSVYDLIDKDSIDTPIEVWNEKITDSINYLLLLKAIVVEQNYHRTHKRMNGAG